MADTRDIDFEALLKRVEFLEKENHSLREEVEILKSNDDEIRAELNIINRFISALTECQSIDEVMTEIESASKQLTNSDNTTFYFMDKATEKFFSEDEGRSWTSHEQAKTLKEIADKQEIQNNGTTAYIPLVTQKGKSLGVIEVQKSEGFDTDNLLRNFAKGGLFVENTKLGLEKEYQHQGRVIDELTQMYNRQGLNEYLENTLVRAFTEGKSINILMSDIDRFKSVNDTYGHPAGDVILQGTAGVFKDLTKDGANSCFRTGGEEMVAILITDTPEQAVDMAETLRRNVENKVNEIIVDDKPMDYSVTVSVGIHEMQPNVPFTPANAREVFDAEFKKADNAVYEAKETGRNKVVCADEQTYVAYLAMKATEVFVKSEGIEDKEAVKGISDMITDSFAAPTEEQGFDTIVDALRTYAVQTSDTMPDISELADFIADKIEAYSEKISNLNYPVAEDTTVDFEFENQDTNVSDVEFDYDEIFASLDTENSSYYDNVSKSGVGVTFSERVSAMKEWADKALDKVNEKNIQKENVLKKNGGAR